jgi:hypothetical protein
MNDEKYLLKKSGHAEAPLNDRVNRKACIKMAF